jgi:hypothetical protein
MGMKLCSVVVLVLLNLAPVVMAQHVVINEVMTANVSAVLDPDNTNFSEWVELYNPGAQSVNLSGYFLSDDRAVPLKWKIAYSYIISSKGFLVIWMDKLNTGLHTNFRARSSREFILLSNSAGEAVDSVIIDYAPPNSSIGRNPDGEDTWYYFQVPTPGKVNIEKIMHSRSSAPVFNKPSGRYSIPLTVELTSPVATATIYYTTDGSEPDASSTRYGGPIPVLPGPSGPG